VKPAVNLIIPSVTYSVVIEQDPKRCNRCHRQAVLFQAYSGRALCREHLQRDVERRARREVRRQGGLRPGDRIAVMPGDGPSAIALRAFLSGRAVGGRLSVLTLQAPSSLPPEVEALRAGCTVLADASVLEDTAARVLSSVLRGRPCDLLAPPSPVGARVVRPFVRVPAAEVRLYAAWVGERPPGESGGHADPFDRFVSEELARHSERHPSAPFSLARLGEVLSCLAKEENG